MRPTAIFYLFWFRCYGLSKVHDCMVVVGFEKSDLFTLVGNSFARKNFKIKNQITVGKNFSRATK